MRNLGDDIGKGALLLGRHGLAPTGGFAATGVSRFVAQQRETSVFGAVSGSYVPVGGGGAGGTPRWKPRER